MKTYDKIEPNEHYTAKELVLNTAIPVKYRTSSGWKFYEALRKGELPYFTVGPGKYPMKVIKGQDVINLITKWETNGK